MARKRCSDENAPKILREIDVYLHNSLARALFGKRSCQDGSSDEVPLDLLYLELVVCDVVKASYDNNVSRLYFQELHFGPPAPEGLLGADLL